MPAFEIIRKVNEELTALKPVIEEKLNLLAKKDAGLPLFFEIASPGAINSSAFQAVSAIDTKVRMLELRITLTTSRVLGFMIAGDDIESAEKIKKLVETETEKMRGFLQDRVISVLPNYSAIRYGTASAQDPAKNETAQ